MSFGFSVGDIILLSQLAYNLYSSVSAGRKGASRDLKELEDVLFSLKCSLDHLGEVSKDVVAQPNQHGGSKFKDKLGEMIRGCASTLQELESVTEKYRTVESRAIGQATAQKDKTKSRTLDDVKRSIQINWHRVRWDYEKQSLQQYREKLTLHTDSINLILTSMIWANSARAEEKSRQGHEKTHTLLEEVLKKPYEDVLLRDMIEDIRNILTQPTPDLKKVSNAALFIAGPSNSAPVISAFSLSPSPIDASFNAFANHMGPSPIDMTTRSVLPIRSSGQAVRKAASATAVDMPFEKCQRIQVIRNGQPNVVGQRDLPSNQDDLNTMRRAVGVREYEAFKQRHPTPKKLHKPSFLKPTTPTMQELRDCISYISTSLPDGKQETDELKCEIERWAQGFSLFVKKQTSNAESDAGLLELLITLNGAVAESAKPARRLFYRVSDSVGLLATLDQVLTTSKSVRIMREIEEFQDAKEEWEDDGGGN